MKDRGRVLRDADLEFLCLAYREGMGAVCLARLAGVLPGLGPAEGVVAACLRTKAYGIVLKSLEMGPLRISDFGLRIGAGPVWNSGGGPCPHGEENKKHEEQLKQGARQTEQRGVRMEVGGGAEAASLSIRNSQSTIRNLLRREVLRRWVPQRERIERVRGVVREISAGTGLGFAFLRGAALERYYLHPEARVCEDVDVLVPEAERGRWEEALLDSGFRYREPDAVREARRTYIGQTEFVHTATGVLLDLQYRLTGNGGIGPVAQDMEGVWGRALRNADCGRRIEEGRGDFHHEANEGNEGATREDIAGTAGQRPRSRAEADWKYTPSSIRNPQSTLRTGQGLAAREFVPAREDLLLESVRHFGHGHDFARGFLRACLDAQRLMIAATPTLPASCSPIHPSSLIFHPFLDWDLVAREAERCECLCVLDFFGHAYNTLYAIPEDGEPLFPGFRRRTGIGSREAERFTAAILRPQLRAEADPGATGPGLVQANRMCLGIAWALDRPRRFLSLLRLLLWPRGAAFILLTRDWPGASTAMKRLHLAAQTLAAAPGILTGGFLRVALCGVRFLVKQTRG